MHIKNTETTTNKQSGNGMLITAITAATATGLVGGVVGSFGLSILLNDNPIPPVPETPPTIVEPTSQKFRVKFYDKNGNEIKVEGEPRTSN